MDAPASLPTDAGPSSPHDPAPAPGPARSRPANDPYANSTFPPPPEWYRAFTGDAWGRHKERRDKSAQKSKDGAEQANDGGEGGDVQWEMRPPRVDWIEEEGRWTAFGEEHQVGGWPLVREPE